MPYTIYITSLLAYLVSGDYKYALFFAFAILFGDGANALEKKIFKTASNKAKYGKRPSGCGNKKGICTGCGIYPEFNKKSKTWGMPSGHAQITSLAATFWTLYLIENYKENKSKDITKLIVQVVFLWILALSVWIQRIYSRCHSVQQVISWRIIWYRFWNFFILFMPSYR